jgi:hypothetical protein
MSIYVPQGVNGLLWQGAGLAPLLQQSAFTACMWVNSRNFANPQGYWFYMTDGVNPLYFQNAGSTTFQVFGGGTLVLNLPGTNVSGVWFFIAITVAGGTTTTPVFTAYYSNPNGNIAASTPLLSVSGTDTHVASNPYQICLGGTAASGGGCDGWIENRRAAVECVS